MTYSYETTEQQWIEFQLYQARRKYLSTSNRPAKIAALIILDGIIAIDVFLSFFWHIEDATNRTMLLSALFVLINWYQFQRLFYSPRLLSKKCRQLLQKNPSFFIKQKTTCTVSDEKLTLEEECGIITVIPIRLLNGVVETPYSIFVFTSHDKAELIPKSVFSTTEEKRRFLEALHS